MGHPRRAHRVDAVQLELFADLRRFGFSVLDLSIVGDDCPDAAIGRQGVTVLLEVKTPRGINNEYKITEGQKLFAQTWRGTPVIFGHKAEQITKQFQRIARSLGRSSTIRFVGA